MKRLVLLWLFVAQAHYSVQSQVPYIRHYFPLRKNQPVQVNTIFQDQSGFLWYGTNQGLFHFDGTTHTRYTQRDSLSDLNVTAINQDASGRVWLGYKSGAISFIDKGVIHGFHPLEGLPSHEISCLLFDPQGRMWIATLNDGLYYFANQRLNRLDQEDGMPDIYVYSIAADHLGTIWAGTDGGLVRCSVVNNKASIRVIDQRSGLPDNIVRKVNVAGDGIVWMGTQDAGMVTYDPARGICTRVFENAWNRGAITDFIVTGNEIWMSVLRAGLMVYDLDTKRTKYYDTISGSVVPATTGLLEDREGNIWAGTKSGLVFTGGAHLEMIDNPGATGSNYVTAITFDTANAMWYTSDKGLYKRWHDGSGRTFTERQLPGTPFYNNTFISLYADVQGFIWAGMYGQGVLRINPVSGKTQVFNEQLRNGNVLSITGRGNSIWMATLGGATHVTLDENDIVVRNYGTEDGLISDYIYQVFEDSKGRAWFATDGKGVDMMDEGGFHHYQEGLASKVVYGFTEDQNRELWANVQSNGLYKFSRQQFRPASASALLRDQNIHCLTTDRGGNLVLMHDLGLDVYNISKGKIRYYGEDAGIRDKKPNLNALAFDANGRLYFGTDNGIVVYREVHKRVSSDPEPVITGLQLFGEFIRRSDHVSLDYNQNYITINYHGLWFQNPENLNFRYQLDNYDRTWLVSRNRSVTYSNLPPGDYTFRLMTSDNDNFNGAKESTLTFTIAPPIWQTVWFYLASVLLLVAAVYTYIKFRERKLRVDKKILEQKVNERTAEIQNKNEEIMAQNEEIQSQAEEIRAINENLESVVAERTRELRKKTVALREYAFINAHKLRSPLASIMGLVDIISTHELTAEDEKIVIEHLKQSSEKLDSVVASITQAIEKKEWN